MGERRETRKRWVPWAWAVLAVLAGQGSCRLQPVRIGAVLPLTGAYSGYGRSLERGVILAAETINSSGGIGGRRMEVLVRDSASSELGAAEAFQTLVERDGVPAVIGGCTTAETLSMAALAERYRRVLLSPSASGARITDAGEFVFRNWPSDEVEGRTLADFAAYALHAAKVLVVWEESPYAEGFRDAFAQRFCAGGRACDLVKFERGQDPAALLKASSGTLAGCHAVLVIGYGANIAPILAALRARPNAPPVLSVSALAEGVFLSGAASSTEGVLFARPQYDPEGGGAVASEFASAYAARYGHEADVYSAHGYDAVLILARAMPGGDLGAESLRARLLGLRGFTGASGATSFDPNGDVVQPCQMFVVLGGRAVPLKTVLNQVLPPIQKRVHDLRSAR